MDSQSPIGFAGGDSNLYGYVLNDPVNLVDVLGLLPFDEDGQKALEYYVINLTFAPNFN